MHDLRALIRYDSAAQSDAMLADLTALPDGAIVAIVAFDAFE